MEQDMNIIMTNPKLFMLLLGCKPKGRHTEQHDVFFGIGNTVKDLVPSIYEFWPDAGKIHIDAWKEVTHVDGYAISVEQIYSSAVFDEKDKLFFINLGGYVKGMFEESHYKVLAVAQSLAGASEKAKKTDFFKTTGYAESRSHIDDKYGIDVDDVYNVEEILPSSVKGGYYIRIIKDDAVVEDQINQGFISLSKL